MLKGQQHKRFFCNWMAFVFSMFFSPNLSTHYLVLENASMKLLQRIVISNT